MEEKEKNKITHKLSSLLIKKPQQSSSQLTTVVPIPKSPKAKPLSIVVVQSSQSSQHREDDEDQKLLLLLVPFDFNNVLAPSIDCLVCKQKTPPCASVDSSSSSWMRFLFVVIKLNTPQKFSLTNFLYSIVAISQC